MKHLAVALTLVSLLAGCGATRTLGGAPLPRGASLDAQATKKPAGELAKVTAWVKANSGGSYWDSPKAKLFPSRDDGNNGTSSRVYAGAAGTWLAKLVEAWTQNHKKPVKVTFDPTQHFMIAVQTSEDEPVVLVAIYDRLADTGRMVDDMNLVDLAYNLKQPQFETFFPKMGNVDDADYWQVQEVMGKKGQHLDI